MTVFALLDEGSTVTLIDADIAKQIGATGPTRGLRIHGAKGMCTSDTRSRRVKLIIRGSGTGDSYSITANTITDLSLPEQPAPGEPVTPKILIGQDNAHLIVSREVREGRDSSRLVSRTALGWIAHGGTGPHCDSTATTLALRVETAADARLRELVKTNFAVDSLGITAATRVNSSEQRAIDLMGSTTRPLPTGRWETGLLWRHPNVTLPDNRRCALKRLESLEKKLKKDDALATAYADKMNQLVTNGYARRLTAREASQAAPRKWYLPHFAVTNPNKPGKLRVVFDAASRCRGTSLNDQLLTGPDLLSSLLGNILRFREGSVAIAADIKEMFLRIKIIPEDQPSQLYLWRAPNQPEPDTYQMSSMMFGATCSPSSAQFVRNKVAGEYEHKYPAAAVAVRTKFYMDDYLDAVDTPKEAAALVYGVGALLTKGGFHLTNWASNSQAAIAGVPPEDRAGSTVQISSGGAETERVLGLVWDPSTDRFLYTFHEAITPNVAARPTKRQLLSTVMKIFDPVGFISCLTIRSKILLQDVWRSSVGWDELITANHAHRWADWLGLLNANSVSIPRRSLNHRKSSVTLHIFCDASEQACCAVAYYTEEIGGTLRATFLASKCKVAPLKPLSVPRLELQAGLIAARLADTIRKESQALISRTCFWTDSAIVLCWLRTDPRTYSAFVANRLGEIDELTSIPDWRWVPTKLNPADIGTRDSEAPDLSLEGRWFAGPSFITAPESEWPEERPPAEKPDDLTLEVRPHYVGLVSITGEALPAIERFSSWHRLVRATAWVLRFIKRCRMGPNRPHAGPLRAEEIKAAENKWIQRSQEDSFHSDLSAIRQGKPVSSNGRLGPLNPFLGPDDVLRMGTRLRALQNTREVARTPIILDGGHPYTRLLIRRYHISADHPSTEKTVAEVRIDYFVLRLRTTARKIAHDCSTCYIRRSKPFPPLMGALPPPRLMHHLRPFTHCGLDYFGPMTITVGRRHEKRYGAIFTCLSTRAIHLELAASLTADSAIMALQRMTARRGQPAALYSDNGTNFHGADAEIKDAVISLNQDPRMLDAVATQGIEWHFIPPVTPHMGGAWERLVRSVKRALGATLKERAPREETLLTALAEAEFVVNNRPLTHISTDPRDEAPLTPNHFLLGSAGKRPQLSLYDKNEEDICLRRQWRIGQQLADMFWRRWLREYLPTMAARQKWHHPTTPLKKDDLVVIMDPALPRNSWPRGRIIEATPAADGQVRTARVQTSTGTYLRPATKLAVILPAPTPSDPALTPARSAAPKRTGAQATQKAGRRGPHKRTRSTQ